MNSPPCGGGVPASVVVWVVAELSPVVEFVSDCAIVVAASAPITAATVASSTRLTARVFLFIVTPPHQLQGAQPFINQFFNIRPIKLQIFTQINTE
jgi:hypothetical protein